MFVLDTIVISYNTVSSKAINRLITGALLSNFHRILRLVIPIKYTDYQSDS